MSYLWPLIKLLQIQFALKTLSKALAPHWLQQWLQTRVVPIVCQVISHTKYYWDFYSAWYCMKGTQPLAICSAWIGSCEFYCLLIEL